MYVHLEIRLHCGVERCMREILKHIFPLHNPRAVIQKIRQNCVKCRIIEKKTCELRMRSHPSTRTTLAPVFYNLQLDICYGFVSKPHRQARTTMPIYALVGVCLLSSATSIMALESLETQEVMLYHDMSRWVMSWHVLGGGQMVSIYVDMWSREVMSEYLWSSCSGWMPF